MFASSTKHLLLILINICDSVLATFLVVAVCLQVLESSFWTFHPSLVDHMFEANMLFLLVTSFYTQTHHFKSLPLFCFSLYTKTHPFTSSLILTKRIFYSCWFFCCHPFLHYNSFPSLLSFLFLSHSHLSLC